MLLLRFVSYTTPWKGYQLLAQEFIPGWPKSRRKRLDVPNLPGQTYAEAAKRFCDNAIPMALAAAATLRAEGKGVPILCAEDAKLKASTHFSGLGCAERCLDILQASYSCKIFKHCNKCSKLKSLVCGTFSRTFLSFLLNIFKLLTDSCQLTSCICLFQLAQANNLPVQIDHVLSCEREADCRAILLKDSSGCSDKDVLNRVAEPSRHSLRNSIGVSKPSIRRMMYVVLKLASFWLWLWV